MTFGGEEAGRRDTLIALAILTVAAFLFRAAHFGDPAIHLDEEFYLFVGDRMLHGELPYVDIWDRKPIGLFLIYAAIRLLGGAGIIQYQLVATACAIATAYAIRGIALKSTGQTGALLGGIAYLAALEALGGGGGQSPVFYNLPMAIAALLVRQTIDDDDPATILRRALLAMLLCGLAIQIKYSVIFEGTFLGLFLLWRLRMARLSWNALLPFGGAMMLVALMPTLAAAAFYASIGQASLFWFNNFVSILQRGSADSSLAVPRLGFLLLVLSPLIAATVLGLIRSQQASAERVFLIGWIVAALLGFAALGNYFNHYALPLAVPLAVGAAAGLTRPPLNIILMTLAVMIPLGIMGYPDLAATRRSQAESAQLADDVKRHLGDGCLFGYDAPPVLYMVTGACHLTRYVFPQHLNYALEARSIGVDPEAETRRILTARPTVIVTSRQPVSDPNFATARIVDEALKRNYRLVANDRFAGRDLQVYALSPPAASSRLSR